MKILFETESDTGFLYVLSLSKYDILLWQINWQWYDIQPSHPPSSRFHTWNLGKWFSNSQKPVNLCFQTIGIYVTTHNIILQVKLFYRRIIHDSWKILKLCNSCFLIFSASINICWFAIKQCKFLSLEPSRRILSVTRSRSSK